MQQEHTGKSHRGLPVSSAEDRLSSTELFAWRSVTKERESAPGAFVAFVREALQRGFSTLAYEIAAEALLRHPAHEELSYLQSLALARAQSTGEARVLVDRLIARIAPNSTLVADAYSLRGRLSKDWLEQTEDPSLRTRLAWDAMANYLKAYRISGSPYPGINAATMAALAGDAEAARAYAEEVARRSEDALSGPAVSDYWVLATLGEACLLLGRGTEALEWYRKARHAAADHLGSVAAMRRQVQLVATCMDVGPEIFDVLRLPGIVAFVGHMIDAPDRRTPRFAPELEPAVAEWIAEAIIRHDARYAYGAAACGADLLFIEALLSRGAEVHVVLPFDVEAFAETSVRSAGESWLERYRSALDRVTAVEVATRETHVGDDVVYEYANGVIGGRAILRARQLGTRATMLAVSDSDSEALPGGTRHAVETWQAKGREVDALDLKGLRRRSASRVRASTRPPLAPLQRPLDRTPSSPRTIRTMLFADIVGFSKLDERVTPAFFVEFLGAVARTLDAMPVQPEMRNTWGDGLFLVYREVLPAVRAAMALVDAVIRGDWAAVGLPPDTSIRVGVHAGPVYAAEDPIIRARNFYGSHVNRAARIEPVTTPGSVFLSEQTACMLELENQSEFAWDPVGEVPLAKGYDIARLYRLRRIKIGADVTKLLDSVI